MVQSVSESGKQTGKGSGTVKGIKGITKYSIVQGIIWLSAIGLAIWVFIIGIEPVNEAELLFPTEQTKSEVLYSGDRITQKFRATYDRLDGVDIVLSYDDNLPSDVMIKISLLRGDETVMEQPLPVNICNKGQLLHLKTDVRNCLGEEMTICVENISDSSVQQGFALLTTTKEYLFPENTDNYLFNGIENNGRLLGLYFYITGFEYYKSFTYAFWVMLAALFLTGFVHQAALKQRHNAPQPAECGSPYH